MICIPMAGMSSRFSKAGYQLPKYMLPIGEENVFSKCIKSFKNYFETELFVFIVRDIHDTPSWVSEQVKLLGIERWVVLTLDTETDGQADTVRLGLKQLKEMQQIDNDELTIFNIDTFRPNLTFHKIIKDTVGVLEVFLGSGDQWSFVKPKRNNCDEVKETAEKQRISPFCSTGLYYFNSANTFLSALEKYEKDYDWINGELYIAPIYNVLIEEDKKVRYYIIDNNDVIFCGTPQEYEILIENLKVTKL